MIKSKFFLFLLLANSFFIACSNYGEANVETTIPVALNFGNTNTTLTSKKEHLYHQQTQLWYFRGKHRENNT